MKAFFYELFDYCHTYNQQWADALILHGDKLTEKTNNLYSHILNAHHIWNARIEEAKPVFKVWDSHLQENFKAIDKQNHHRTLQILDTIDLSNSISYSNAKGDPYINTVKDMLFQVVNHTTYHRGQIAMEFRQAGLEPLLTDYIFYKRK
jgi:uncharacterized damage-inducible protein DinB